MSVTKFEDITNAVGQIISTDADIITFCEEYLGHKLNGIDNSIYHQNHLPSSPSFEINKEPEIHFKNKAVEDRGIRSAWSMNIMFFGDFSGEQEDNEEFALPNGAKEVKNGIITYTPADTMRIIARMVGEAITQNIGCFVAGVWTETYTIDTSVYYAEENGVVGSRIDIDLYEVTTVYNN